ncbi:hypothetical protein [Thalassotalea litorea]|uniref:hypothetical protein n=1 Tax=Thalassotalea litorea TaxID=2020715 RepID=UPI0037358903
MDKAAGYTFILGSILMVVLMLIPYEEANATSLDWDIRLEALMSNWNFVATIWRFELTAAIALAWSSFHFAKENSSWYLVAIAHVIYIVMYGVMLAGYPEARTQEGYNTLFQIALWIFSVANLLWVLGIGLIVSQYSGWLKYVGFITTSILSLTMIGVFFRLLTFEDVYYVMPLVIVVYLLNIIIGAKYVKVLNERRTS